MFPFYAVARSGGRSMIYDGFAGIMKKVKMSTIKRASDSRRTNVQQCVSTPVLAVGACTAPPSVVC